MNDAHDNAADDKAMLEKFNDDSYIKGASKIGTENGKSAASWVFDGNTTQETYAWFVKGIDDGDPEVLDSVREPSLSGEFADDYSERELADDLDIPEDDSALLDECADAYNQAASSAFWLEVERVARLHTEAR